MTYFFTPYPYRQARRWALAQDDRHDFSLPVNISEKEDRFVLTALVPGLKAEDLNIRILDDVVTLTGEFKADENEYVLRELPHGSFSRTLRLSAPLDAEKAEAKIAAGVLTLHLPKAESARPRIIEVKAK
ncbi:MAG: Hsp20/alpha crystallin family protein [Anaerolineales bacterium]|jgi:HSP20 family protein